MNRISFFTVVHLFCWLCAAKGLAELPEVANARRHGARGRVTLRVVDSAGKPVEGARISACLFPSDSYADVDGRDGETDINGCLALVGTTVDKLTYGVSKDEYYKTEGTYWFYRRGEDCVRDGLWQPWNPTNLVVLKEMRKPVAMYAKRVDAPVPVRGASVGFDLEAGDWVVPHGRGKQPDFLFTYKADVQDHWNASLELAIASTNEMDGFVRAKKDMGSGLLSAYEAPSSGYRPETRFAFVTTTDRDLRVEKLGDTEYLVFRVRTVLDDRGNIVGARYGKIYGPIEFGVGKEHHLRFVYYLNPTDNDRNLEFDPLRNLMPNPGRTPVNMP